MPKKRRRVSQKGEENYRKIKRVFFVLMDIITISAFALALYYTYFEDYTKTILFLVIGTLILMYFIVRGVIRKKGR